MHWKCLINMNCFSSFFQGEANDDQPFVANSDRGDNANNNLYLYNVSIWPKYDNVLTYFLAHSHPI